MRAPPNKCYTLFKVDFFILHLSKDFNWRQLNICFVVLVILEVLVVLVVLVIQHVDCVTFCTSFVIKGVIINRERERERAREREKKKEEE